MLPWEADGPQPTPPPRPPPAHGDQTTGRFPSSSPQPLSSSRLPLSSDYPPCPYKRCKAPAVTLKMNRSGEEGGRGEKGQNPPNFCFIVIDQLFAAPSFPASLRRARLGGGTPLRSPRPGCRPGSPGRAGPPLPSRGFSSEPGTGSPALSQQLEWQPGGWSEFCPPAPLMLEASSSLSLLLVALGVFSGRFSSL